MRVYAFDAEFTDVDVKKARLVSFAAVPVVGDYVVDVARSTYVEVKRESVGKSAVIHGITGGSGTVTEEEAMRLLRDVVQNSLLIVFGRLDVKFIKHHLKADFRYIDVASAYLDWVSKRENLELYLTKEGVDLLKICKKLGVALVEQVFHHALVDAVHTGLLYLKLKSMGVRLKVEKP
ncbi:MAG: 3'-5' exonuclease [Pyrobaculum sp.]